MKTKVFFGIGDFAFASMTNVESYFFNFFLTNVAEFSLGVVTTIATITSTIDAALCWIYGGIINAVKPGKFGRYRTWLVTLPWLVPFLYLFQFMKIGDGVVSYVVVVLGFVLSHIVWNIPWVANVTLVSVCGRTPAGRARMSSSRATWSSISSITFGYIGPPLAIFLAPIIGEQNRYGGVAFVLGVFMVLGYFINFFVTSGLEEIESAADIAKKQSKTKATPKDMGKAFAQNPSLICLMIADIPRHCLNFTAMGIIPYYFQYVGQNMALMPIYILLVNGIARTIGAYMSGILAKKLSGRSALLMTYSVMFVSLLLVYMNYLNVYMMITFMFFVNMAIGYTNAAMIACYADTAVYAQWKLGVDARGWIVGLNVLPLKIGVIGRSTIINISLAMIGFNAAAIRANPELITPALQRGITSAFTLIPCAMLVVGLLLLLFGYKLSKEKLAQYQEEINARAKA